MPVDYPQIDEDLGLDWRGLAEALGARARALATRKRKRKRKQGANLRRIEGKLRRQAAAQVGESLSGRGVQWTKKTIR